MATVSAKLLLSSFTQFHTFEMFLHRCQVIPFAFEVGPTQSRDATFLASVSDSAKKQVAAFVKSKVDVAALLLHFTTSKESNLVAAAGCKNKIYFKIILKLYQTSRFQKFPFFGRY